MTADGDEGTNQPEPDSNPYAPPIAALDAATGLPAALRSPTLFYWLHAVVSGAIAAGDLILGLVFSLMSRLIVPSMKVTANPLRSVILECAVASLVCAAVAAWWVRQAIAHREPSIRPCREGLAMRTVAIWSARVTTFYVPWPELVSAEARGVLGRKKVVVLIRVEPYEIKFTNFDFPLSRLKTVAAAIVALAGDEAAHAALPGWDRPPAS
jgi:hypothetical protein